MKLVEDLKNDPKDLVYDTYLRVCDYPKDYEKITKKKMFEDIINTYNQKDFIFSFCTKRELEFLKMIINKKINLMEFSKYDWEIKTLSDKKIISITDFRIYDELLDSVKDALKTYEKYPKMNIQEIIIFMIAVIRINGELLTKALESMITSMTNMDSKKFDNLLCNPLFRYYCSFRSEYIPSLKSEQETICYIDYWDIFDDLSEKRKEYGIAGEKAINLEDYYDMFYYGITVKNNKYGQKLMKKLDEINIKWSLLKIIDEIRLLHNYELIDYVFEEEDLKDLIIKTLNDTPCGVMNGFTPNEYDKEMEKEKALNYKFTVVPQNNAHLCKKAADEYYKLYFGLLEYVNNKEKITPNIVIYEQKHINPMDIRKIDDYLWKNKETIIPEFIEKNPFNFNEEELTIIKGFINSVTSDKFVIVGFEREYTMILDMETGKIYMVKGVRADFDQILPNLELPQFIGTTLLMYKDTIIFKGILYNSEIKFGNDVKELIIREMEKAMKYYHI